MIIVFESKVFESFHNEKKNHPIKSTQFTGKEIGRNLSGNGCV